MDLQKARTCLEEIVNIGKGFDFLPCLMFGSLLGEIREGKFLDNEYDIDLFFIQKDSDNFSKAYNDFYHFSNRIKQREYKIKDCSTSLFLALKKDDVLIDINLGVFLEDKYVINSDIFIDVYPSRFFRNLKEIKFEGCKVFVPENEEGLIEYYYGMNWRIPMNLQEAEKEIMKTRIWKDR
jgi:phosphorylcholine metabolism protein LicD